MTTNVADAHDLGSGVVACVYSPISDHHLPLIGPISADWQVLTWSIVPGANGMSTYLIVLRAKSMTAQDVPTHMRLETSFGPRNLMLRPASTPLPTLFAAALSELLLLVAGQQTTQDLSVLIAVLARLPVAETARAPLVGRLTSAGGRSQMQLDGCHAGYYIVGRNGEEAPKASVTAIRYDGCDPIQTILELDGILAAGSFWLLGAGQFRALSVTENG